VVGRGEEGEGQTTNRGRRRVRKRLTEGGKNVGDSFNFGEERAWRPRSWTEGHRGRGGLPREGFQRRTRGERKVRTAATTCFKAVRQRRNGGGEGPEGGAVATQHVVGWWLQHTAIGCGRQPEDGSVGPRVGEAGEKRERERRKQGRLAGGPARRVGPSWQWGYDR
jgi:hypothetical protein